MTTKSKKKLETYTVLRSLTVWQRMEVEANDPEEVRRFVKSRRAVTKWETYQEDDDWQPVVLKRRRNGAYDLY